MAFEHLLLEFERNVATGRGAVESKLSDSDESRAPTLGVLLPSRFKAGLVELGRMATLEGPRMDAETAPERILQVWLRQEFRLSVPSARTVGRDDSAACARLFGALHCHLEIDRRIIEMAVRVDHQDPRLGGVFAERDRSREDLVGVLEGINQSQGAGTNFAAELEHLRANRLGFGGLKKTGFEEPARIFLDAS